MKLTTVTALLLVTMLVTGATVAEAGSAGRRNTAIALTAGALYNFGRRNNTTALLMGAGAAYAWKRYEDARRAERAHPVYSGTSYRAYSRSGPHYVAYHHAAHHAAATTSTSTSAAAQLAAQKAAIEQLNAANAAQAVQQQALMSRLNTMQTQMNQLQEDKSKLETQLQQQESDTRAAHNWLFALLGLAGIGGLWAGIRRFGSQRRIPMNAVTAS